MQTKLFRRANWIIAPVAVLLLLPQIVAGTVVQGTVSGEWDPAGSPYEVVGDVTVQAGDTLWIDSGVEVQFSQNCNLKVYGTLIAIGFDFSPVVFKGAQNVAGYWGSIYFDGASSECLLSTVQIQDALTGVVAIACSLGVLNATFSNNVTGMDCKTNANPRVEGCTFAANTNSAIRIQDSSPWVLQCTFEQNSLGDLQPTLTVSGTGTPHIERCVFRDNGDVAIQVNLADSAVIANNSIVSNQAGITVDQSSCLISSNIVSDNGDIGIGVYGPIFVNVRYNDSWNNSTANYDGDLANLGVPSTVNVRGDSCDAWQNISENPHFLWPDSTDLTLAADSPCIDAGDPSNPAGIEFLGDGVDIGAFEHDPDDQRLPVELVALTWSDGELFWTTASETDNFGFLVQYSTDGRTWETLGFVPGAGTTTRNHRYSYRAEKSGFYRLVQIDTDGSKHASEPVEVKGTRVPRSVRLAVFPNPANPGATVQLEIPDGQEDQELSVRVYDVRGRQVATLFRGKARSCPERMRWEGRDELGNSLPSGTYTVVLRAGDAQVARKITLLR